MPIEMDWDTRVALDKFERDLLENPVYFGQQVTGQGFRSIDEAVVNKLFELLGTGKASTTYQSRFRSNIGALQSRRRVADIARGQSGLGEGGMRPGTSEGGYSITDFLGDVVLPSNTPFASGQTTRDIFLGLPNVINDRPDLIEPGPEANRAWANLFLRGLNPAEQYDIFSAAYRPTASSFGNWQRGQEEKNVLARFDPKAPDGDEQLAYFRQKAGQGILPDIDFAKYNQFTSAEFQDLNANFLGTVKTHNPQYWGLLNSFWGGDTARMEAKIGTVTIGAVLQLQQNFWNSASGRSDPNHQNAAAFREKYGYWPSVFEVDTGVPLLAKMAPAMIDPRYG